MNAFVSPTIEEKAKVRRVIRDEIMAHYAEEIKCSGFWRELLLRLKIEREISAELRRKFPPQALFAVR